MKLSDLQFDYPENLIATQPDPQWRALYCDGRQEFLPVEVSQTDVLELFQPGDVLVVNDTQVLKRRVFSECGLEILFLECQGENQWQVLFPAKKTKVGQSIALPGGVKMILLEKGIPQRVQLQGQHSDALSEAIDESYFDQFGEYALPPYIQQARQQRHTCDQDDSWYKTDWGKSYGSYAAPTASLHFKKNQLEALKQKGVHVLSVTLHVGLGTFLPIRVEDTNEHTMHSEWAFIAADVCESLKLAKAEGRRIWALGTTVTRAVESFGHGLLNVSDNGSYSGWTDIFIQPGYQWTYVNGLLTNFHQPGSTLIALVAAFAELEKVKSAYRFAIEKKFKLFSYGDLTIWTR